jgi:lipopolysaccharide biosynthesis glycosyltransferase
MSHHSIESAVPPVVCAVDDAYVGALCVLLQSLATARADGAADLRLIVIYRRLTEANRRRIEFHARRLGLHVELCTTGRADDPYPVSDWVTDAVYLRLAIPDALSDIPLVLYLDCDLLVVRDLGPLLRQRLDGAVLAAVRNPSNPVLGVGDALPGWRDLGLAPSREYFNSGVMLLDLAECRRRGTFEKCYSFLEDMPQHVRFWDQDALNWAVDDDWLRLDRRWNTFPLSALSQLPAFRYVAEEIVPLRQLIDDEDTAAILHFAGPWKPWTPIFPESPARDLYRSFMRTVKEAEPDEGFG